MIQRLSRRGTRNLFIPFLMAFLAPAVRAQVVVPTVPSLPSMPILPALPAPVVPLPQTPLPGLPWPSVPPLLPTIPVPGKAPVIRDIPPYSGQVVPVTLPGPALPKIPLRMTDSGFGDDDGPASAGVFAKLPRPRKPLPPAAAAVRLPVKKPATADIKLVGNWLDEVFDQRAVDVQEEELVLAR